MKPYPVLERKRDGGSLRQEEIQAAVDGAVDGSWSDGQLSALLMAMVIRGLDHEETRFLTQAMLESGEQWDLAKEFPTLTDKHSTGGVGDKISLVLAPVLAACDVPVAMLTGRALGHTGGTADKLETISGLDLALDRARTLDLLHEVGMALGIATRDIAPADSRLYLLRDQSATVESIPLITASILSKKLASGAAALVFDVKTGNGAFMSKQEDAEELARLLVDTWSSMGRKASALVTDMSQPLGTWVGNRAEVRETLECLEGVGPADVMELTYALAIELSILTGRELSREDFESAVDSGLARERFDSWARAQGADARWLAEPDLGLAPHEHVLRAPHSGYLNRVDTRRLGLLLGEAGASRSSVEGTIDPGVSLRYSARLGDQITAGEEIARVYLRSRDDRMADALLGCFQQGPETAGAPALVLKSIR